MNFTYLHIFALGYLLLGGCPITVEAGPVTAGVCYAGCAAVVVACFAASGSIFGTISKAEINQNPFLKSCNDAFSLCEEGCMKLLMSFSP